MTKKTLRRRGYREQEEPQSELLLENTLKGMLYELFDAVSELLLENSLKGMLYELFQR